MEFIKDLKNVQRGRIKEYADKYGQYVKASSWEKADIALPSATQNEINAQGAQKLVNSES